MMICLGLYYLIGIGSVIFPSVIKINQKNGFTICFSFFTEDLEFISFMQKIFQEHQADLQQDL